MKRIFIFVLSMLLLFAAHSQASILDELEANEKKLKNLVAFNNDMIVLNLVFILGIFEAIPYALEKKRYEKNLASVRKTKKVLTSMQKFQWHQNLEPYEQASLDKFLECFGDWAPIDQAERIEKILELNSSYSGKAFPKFNVDSHKFFDFYGELIELVRGHVFYDAKVVLQL